MSEVLIPSSGKTNTVKLFLQALFSRVLSEFSLLIKKTQKATQNEHYSPDQHQLQRPRNLSFHTHLSLLQT